MICHFIWGQKIKFQAEEVITISTVENIIHYFNFVLFKFLLGKKPERRFLTLKCKCSWMAPKKQLPISNFIYSGPALISIKIAVSLVPCEFSWKLLRNSPLSETKEKPS